MPKEAMLSTRLVARKPGRLAGLDAAALAFAALDRTVTVTRHLADGDDVAPAAVIAEVTGPARAILGAERVALNLLTHLSGVATATADVVQAVKPYGTRVACTRKTLPGLRALQKHAVRAGSGMNHRFGLFDAILIKDNHIAAAGGLREALRAAKLGAGHLVKIQVEVDDLDQLDAAMREGVDAVLLDNMGPAMLAEAIRLVARRAATEASGGITPETVTEIAATGVDVVSLGWLTHS
ncbi:carboxylating nicotinate-nucleotide diphosphorylase, partial [Nostoc sp. NIES-2111]